MSDGLAREPLGAGPGSTRTRRPRDTRGGFESRSVAAGPCGDGGYSLVELLVCVAVLGLVMSAAVADTRHARRQVAADGAARHLALTLRAARTEAVLRGRSVAVQFVASTDGVGYRVVADGNGNGVRGSEIEVGVDPALGPVRRLDHDFGGIRFGVGCECPGIDGGETLTQASPPVVFGESGLAVFTAHGTATSGTAYVTAGDPTASYAVRVLGSTGRTRVLRFDPARSAWADR